MRTGEGVGLEPGDVDDWSAGVKRLELAQAPLGAQVRRPPCRPCDVVLLLPAPALFGPPLASLVSAALDERQVARVRYRSAADQEATHVCVEPLPLVVVRKSVRGCANGALARGDLNHLQSSRRRAAIGVCRRPADGLVPVQPRQLDRLEHRLPVLLLVAQHQLVQFAYAVRLCDLERVAADLVQVIARLCRAQEIELTAISAGRLEGVVGFGQIAPQHRLTGKPVDQP